MLIAQLLLSYQVGMLQGVNEDYAEGEARADEQDGDVHQVEVGADVRWVALVRQLRDREKAEKAESEQDWTEGSVHEFGHTIDNLIEPLAELVTTH